jgi:hypothetical protein
MKVTGDTFSFHHKRKGAEPLPDRTLESFIQKSTEGATPNL